MASSGSQYDWLMCLHPGDGVIDIHHVGNALSQSEHGDRIVNGYIEPRGCCLFGGCSSGLSPILSSLAGEPHNPGIHHGAESIYISFFSILKRKMDALDRHVGCPRDSLDCRKLATTKFV